MVENIGWRAPPRVLGAVVVSFDRVEIPYGAYWSTPFAKWQGNLQHLHAMKFAAWVAFVPLWAIVVYAVVAHWVWGPGGWLNKLGVLDYAGGLVVEIVSGSSALALALVLGPRIGFNKDAMRPHNLPLVLLGVGLLWFGWFGFNGGSGFSTGNPSVLAFTNTLLCPACTLVVWFALDLLRGRKVTAIGAATAIVVGCVAITPAGGYVSPGWAMLLGALAALSVRPARRLRSS